MRPGGGCARCFTRTPAQALARARCAGAGSGTSGSLRPLGAPATPECWSVQECAQACQKLYESCHKSHGQGLSARGEGLGSTERLGCLGSTGQSHSHGDSDHSQWRPRQVWLEPVLNTAVAWPSLWAPTLTSTSAWWAVAGRSGPPMSTSGVKSFGRDGELGLLLNSTSLILTSGSSSRKRLGFIATCRPRNIRRLA